MVNDEERLNTMPTGFLHGSQINIQLLSEKRNAVLKMTGKSNIMIKKEMKNKIDTHQGPLIARCKDIYNSSKYANSPIVVIGDESVNEFPEADGKIEVQTCGNEAIDSIIYALPLQLLSYHASWARGVDPDTLRRHDETYDYIETIFIFPPGTH